MLNPTDEFTVNQMTLLRLLRSKKQVTRAELTEISGLSTLTVTKTVSEFLSHGLICEYGRTLSTGGRKAVSLGLNPEYGYALSVDIGAPSVKIGIIDLTGEVMFREYIYDRDPGFPKIPSFIITPSEVASRLRVLLEEYGRESCLGVGFGISGIIDKERESVVFCPNIAGWDSFNIIDYFVRELGVPVFLDTSARCMALGEQYYGSAVGIDDFVLVSIGFSVAAGIVVNGKMFRGGNGSAGELGHTLVKDTEEICTCGNKGCLELFVTVPMIVSRIKESLKLSWDYSLVKSIIPRLDDIDIMTVIKADDLGDKIVYREIAEVGNIIGIALANMAKLLNPNKIILSGGLVDALPLISNSAESAVRSRCLSTVGQNLTFSNASLGKDCAIIGCATQALNSFFE